MGKFKHHTKDIFGIAVRALDSGGRRESAYLTTWNVAGRCTNPFTVQLSGRGYRDVQDRYADSAAGIDIDVRCRQCEHCLKARAYLWTQRALQEARTHVRTWFGTLTINPGWHDHVRLLATRVKAVNGSDFDELDAEQQFAARHAIVSREITKYLKRLRKEAGTSFRYLVVAEAHKSGVPHYHLLIHEKASDRPIRYEELRTFWPHGFYQYRLVKERHEATYLCKYLSKDMRARVRASQSYGQTPSMTIDLPDERGKSPAKGGTRPLNNRATF